MFYRGNIIIDSITHTWEQFSERLHSHQCKTALDLFSNQKFFLSRTEISGKEMVIHTTVPLGTVLERLNSSESVLWRGNESQTVNSING